MQNEETQQANDNPSKFQKALSSLRNCWQKASNKIRALICSLKTMLNKGIENFFKKSNSTQVFYAALLSLFLFVVITSYIIPWLLPEQTPNNQTTSFLEKILTSNGFWTLITAFISSPVLFVIWRFRDNNATQQINNARKDTNLKEFQKLAEWVSGAHLEGAKEGAKKENVDQATLEKIREYVGVSEKSSIQSYSKQYGAVGLQIAAVYNLLPFYRGDNGDDFKKPALNLLISAWLAMQQSELEKSDDKLNIDSIQKNAQSPLGIAITRVLLALNHNDELCLREHPEVFPNLCLAGMDFHTAGVDERARTTLFNKISAPNINLIGANLQEAELQGAKLQGADLQGAELQGADLQGANLQRADLRGANLHKAELQRAELQRADLQRADLQEANLQKAELLGAKLQGAYLLRADLKYATLDEEQREYIKRYFKDVLLEDS